MMTRAPFTRRLAVILAVTMFQTSIAGAVSLVPGKLAVLEPPMPMAEMRAAWDGIRSEVYLDPLLLVKGREEVLKVLLEWRQAGQAVRSAYRTADRITLDRTQVLIEEAWAFYYQFNYDSATQVLNQAEELLSTPGDSGFRTHLMFEVQVLSGIAARAAGDKSYINSFKKAAALEPTRELPSERYSPETINIFNGIRRKLLNGAQVSLFVDGSPADASVKVGGREPGRMVPDTGYLLLPGRHFIEAMAPGYEPWSLTLDAERFEPANVRFQLLPTGPEDDPDSFFLQRLRAGDRSYMILLAEKLNVDYLLIPDPDGNVLRIWLIDREGRSVDHIVLWEAGDTRESGALKVARVLEPVRQKWDHSRTMAGAPFSLPAYSEDLPEGSNAGEGPRIWTRYALAIGILLLVGAAAASESGGSTRIEATW
ncbi:MAG: hypothetical protein RRA15_13115 [bacterium]|nr:hypothetical protein [bacterium]